MEQSTVLTICERAFSEYLSTYSNQYDSKFSDYRIPAPTEDMVTLLRNEEYLCNKLSEFMSIDVETCAFDMRKVANEYLDSYSTKYQLESENIDREYQQNKEQLAKKHAMLEQSAAEDANSEVQKAVVKRDALSKYKGNLSEVFERYSILPDDVKVSDDISIDELCELYDSAIQTCETYFKATNSKAVKLLEVDLSKLTDYEGWLYLFGIVIAVTALSPILLALYSYKSIKSTRNIYSKLDNLKLASALMYESDFERFLDKSKYSVEDIDTTELDAKKEEALSGLESVENVASAFNEYINTHIDELQAKCNDAYESACQHKQNAVTAIREAYVSVHKAVEALKESLKPFGSFVYDHTYYNRTFQIGLINGAIPVNIDMPQMNINFVKTDLQDNTLLPFIKILLLNALMNVKEKHTYVTIVDSTDLGTHFSEFFDTRFPDVVKIFTDEPNKAIEEIKAEEAKRIKTLKTRDIDSVNKEFEEIGKVTTDYKIYIITGDVSKLVEDESFLGLMRHSARFGVWIWLFGPDLGLSECLTYRRVPKLSEGSLLEYTHELYTSVLDNYAEAYENSKDRGILYNQNFANKYIPRDKWWTFSTKDGIDLHFGLVDGDPDKGYPITLGDAPVHGNMVGATGAGKSVCINQLLASLITMYSPDELQLCMIDFKNVEFSFYADQETHSFSRLPHSKVLAGTKDGEYAVSIFKYLCEEMDKRTAIFSEAGVKNLSEYRTKYPDKIMPRILLLIDEYHVMFTELPDKIVQIISASIRSLAKLARFCGCHMLFTSQSMKGTMDKDVQDQFALRVALRCSADTAMAVLGSDEPSKLKTKNGYLYTNENGGNTTDGNRLWRTPFIPTPDLESIITEINKMWNKPNMVEFYDEGRTYTDETLHDWYAKYPDVWSDPHIMIIGEKTSYSENKAPCNFKFMRDDGENLLVFGNSTSDTLNIVMTIVDNIKHHKDATIMMCSADRDAVHIIDMPNIVSEALAPFTNPSQKLEDLMDFWDKLITARKEKNPDELRPVYIFCVYYEKSTGYGRNSNSRVSNRFESIMQDAPSVDVHFIMVLKNKGDLMSSSFKMFNHKIMLTCEAGVCMQICDDDRPSKFPTNPKDGVFGLYTTLGDSMKFKVYQHTFANPIVSNEVFIG